MASPNPNWPAVSFQVAFNANPNDPAAVPTWTDLTSRLLEFTVSRGRQYELDQTQAGEFTAVLADPDEALNPANSASPYWPNVLPYRRFALQAMWPPNPALAGGPNLWNSGAVQPGTSATVDPTFESYTVGASVPWIGQTFGGISPAVSSTQAWQGTKSLGWTVTAGTGRQMQWAVATVPGAQYTASLYVYQTAANSFSFFAAGAPAGTTSATGAWTRVTATWTATAVNSTLVAGHTSVTNPGSVFIDAVQVEAGSSASAFSAVGPVIYPLMAGYIERWPSVWNHQGTYGICQVTGVDPLGVLAAATLDSELSNQVQTDSPTYYWPLWESAGAQAFANTTLAGQPPLQVYTSPSGAGNGLVAGDSALPIPGDNGGVRVTLTPGNGANAGLMDCQLLNAGAVGLGGSQGISPIPANPAVAWSASVLAWAGVSPYTDTRKGTTQTLVTLACPPQGSNQAQPLTVGVTGVNYLVGQGFDTGFETEPVGNNPLNWGTLLFTPLTVSSTRAWEGSHSATFAVQASPSTQGVFTSCNLTVGQQYTFSCWVNQTVGNTAQVGVMNSTGNPLPFDVAGTSTTAVNTWVRLTVTFTASVTPTYFWVVCPGTVGSNATVYMDGIQLEAGPTASAYSALYHNAFVSYEGPNGVTLTAVESGTNDADAKMRMWVGTVTQSPAGNTTVNLQVDNTQTATALATTASLGGQLPAGASIVQVGGQATMGLVGQTWNGQVAHVGLWNTALTGGQIAGIYFAGQTGYGPYTFGTEQSGGRISRWLSYVFHGSSAIDTGQSLMDTSPVQRANFALDAMNGVVLGEGGQLYADKSGFVVFKARSARFQTTTAKWALGEQETPYGEDVAFDFDPTQVFDDVTVTRLGGQALPVYAPSYLNYQPGIDSSDGTYGGIVAHVTDAAAIFTYGDRQLTAEVNTASDAETVDHANYWLNRYKQPVQRLNTLTLSAASNPSAWPTVLGMELNDRASVKRRTATFTMSDGFFVEKLDVAVNFAAGQWDVSVQASPVDKQQAWLLGDSTFGVLGSTTTLGW